MSWPVLDHEVPFGFAHRGGTDVAPGNTMAAFEHSVALGYRYIETDARVTSDGVLVMFHDDDLQPTTGVIGTIEGKSWDEVSRLMVGGIEPIPRLGEAVKRFPTVRWNIEPKAPSAVDPLLDFIDSAGLRDRICIGSFSDRTLRRVRQRSGTDLCRSPGPLGVATVLAAAIVWPRWRPPFGALQIPRRFHFVPLATRWLIACVHRLGLQVHVWTINEEAEMVDLLDRGVDAIMTDSVAVLRDVLIRRGQWPHEAESQE